MEYPQRRVYVRRGTRMTESQARGYRNLDGFRLAEPESPQDSFDDVRPLLVEIGFGMGQALANFAESQSDWNCLGVDVYRPGIGSLVRECETRSLLNIRIVEGEGLTTIERFPLDAIDMLWVFFPDPWPKRRHFKRRLINSPFLKVVATKLRIGGKIYVATDWEPYAEVIQDALDSNCHFEGHRTGRPSWRPKTKFEDRGIALGHEVFDFEYARVN